MTSLEQIEYDALVAENKSLSAQLLELHDLRASFLVNVSKLAKISAAFGIQAALPDTETQPFFQRAIDERLGRERMLKREMATAMERRDAKQTALEIATFFRSAGWTTTQAIEATVEKLRIAGLK